MLLSLIGLIVGTGCFDQHPTAPPDDLQPSLALGAPDVPIGGCADLEVQLLGGNGVRVAVADDSSCGSLRIVQDSVATFNASTKVLRLPLAIRNAGTIGVRPVARLYGWHDSITIVQPSGRINTTAGSPIAFQSPDSSMSATAPRLANAKLWRYDTLLGPTGTVQQLAAGDTSRMRWLLLKVADTAVKEFRVRVRLQAETGAAASLIPPNYIPQAIYADTNVVANSPIFPARFVRNVVEVMFSASASRDQRQAAIDLVQGEIIGGMRYFTNGDGVYLVRIRGDSTGQAVLDAIRQLEQLPQVIGATFHSVGLQRPLYLRPRDDGDFTSWKLSPDAADGANWALEAINAPFGWGCDTGNAAAKIAVVDHGFYAAKDLVTTKAIGRDVFTGADAREAAHGTRVASVLAARGNNRQGITGVVWAADLRLYETMLDFTGRPMSVTAGATHLTTMQAVSRAANDGARIINLSSGLHARLVPGFTGDRAQDTLVVVDFAKRLRNVLTYLAQQNRRPLVVIAAGNDSLDAFASGYPAVKLPSVTADARIREQVLVVAASNRAGELWTGPRAGDVFPSGSNYGSLVDIVAPGDSIFTIGYGNSTAYVSGTSFAAPLVSGVAGLLLAFDPSSVMTAAEMRRLVLAGADSGGRTAGGYRLLDAHEALKEAARRPRAPLCGNRVWAVNGQITTQRRTSAEVLATLPRPVWLPEVYHGGKKIGYKLAKLNEPVWLSSGVNASCGVINYQSNGTWSVAPPPCDSATTWLSGDTVGVRGGTFYSAKGYSHDRDSVARVASCGSNCYQVLLNEQPLAQISYVSTNSAWSRIAYSPLGDELFVALSPAGDGRLYDGRMYGSATAADVFAVRITDGAVVPLPAWHISGAGIWALAVSEDGRQIAAAVGPSVAPPDCRIEYRASTGGPLSPSVAPLAANDACISTVYGTVAQIGPRLPATISPRRQLP